MKPESDADSELNRKYLARIHILKQELGLDDTVYRLMIQRIAPGARSSAELPLDRKKELIQSMARMKLEIPFVSRPSAQRMIYRIGRLLAGRTWAYADGMAKKMFGLTSIRFANDLQLHKIIAALEYDSRRRD